MEQYEYEAREGIILLEDIDGDRDKSPWGTSSVQEGFRVADHCTGKLGYLSAAARHLQSILKDKYPTNSNLAMTGVANRLMA